MTKNTLVHICTFYLLATHAENLPFWHNISTSVQLQFEPQWLKSSYCLFF